MFSVDYFDDITLIEIAQAQVYAVGLVHAIFEEGPGVPLPHLSLWYELVSLHQLSLLVIWSSNLAQTLAIRHF